MKWGSFTYKSLLTTKQPDRSVVELSLQKKTKETKRNWFDEVSERELQYNKSEVVKLL